MAAASQAAIAVQASAEMLSAGALCRRRDTLPWTPSKPAPTARSRKPRLLMVISLATMLTVPYLLTYKDSENKSSRKYKDAILLCNM